MELTGQVVGHYRVLGLIGSGGMGVVYRGEDTRLGRSVALKFLPAGVMDADAIQRFRREARSASALNHPHICTLYDIGDHDGAPFLVLEYLEGQTLTERLRQGALPVDTAIDLVAQIADALACAHGGGIVHRDVKPGNVFITGRGDAKVLDFGLAKHAGSVPDDAETLVGSAHLTHAGTTLGTIAYMSPEQARAEEVDARSDIFSLGVVLYEALTARLPFRGPSPAVIFNEILSRQPVPPSQINHEVPAELDRIVARALEKDRDLRYQTAADLRADLKRLRHPSAASVTGAAPAAKPRSRAVWLSAALGALLVIGGALGWWLWQSSRPGPPTPTMTMKQVTNSGLAQLAAVSPDGKFVAYVEERGNQKTLSMRQLATGSVVELAPATAKNYYGLTISPDGSFVYAVRESETSPDTSWLYRIPALGGTPRLLLENVDSRAAFSRDGQRLAFARGNDTIAFFTANLDGTAAREFAKRPSKDIWSRQLAWSPDGQEIAFLGPQGINIIRIDGGQGRAIGIPGWTLVESLTWLPTGDFLVTAEQSQGELSSRHQIVRVSSDGQRSVRLTTDLNDYHEASFSADGSSVTAVQQSATARIWMSEPNQPDRVQPLSGGRSDGISALVFLDEHRLAFADQLSNGWLVNDDGSGLKPLLSEGSTAGNLSACGRGSKVVFERRVGDKFQVVLADTQTGNERTLTEPSAELAFPTCSSDGNTVFYSADGIRRVPASGGAASLVVAKGHQAEISPDGTLMAMHGFEGANERVVLASMSSGKNIRVLLNVPSRVRWAPDGKSVLVAINDGQVGNLWSVPIDGSPRRQLTHFTDELIFRFDQSPGGRFAISRGRGTKDIVLLSAEPSVR